MAKYTSIKIAGLYNGTFILESLAFVIEVFRRKLCRLIKE
jgi:hypothetical protein